VGESKIIVVTTNYVPGMKITKTLGPAFGIVVRSRGLGGNIVAGLRSIVGGEINEYTKMLTDARDHSVARLMDNATAIGANAIVDMRFDSSEIGQMMTEIVAYGTAVVVEQDSGKTAPVSLR
jgi:uncharacterized protein YbjQ (UPF0145 family)